MKPNKINSIHRIVCDEIPVIDEQKVLENWLNEEGIKLFRINQAESGGVEKWLVQKLKVDVISQYAKEVFKGVEVKYK